MISSLVNDWHSQGYLLNIPAFTAEPKRPAVEPGRNNAVASFELRIPDNKVERYCNADSIRILCMAR